MPPISCDSVLPHNGELHLAREPAVLSLGDREFESNVSIAVQCHRSPEIVFSGSFESDQHPLAILGLAFQDRSDSLRILSSGDVVDVHASQLGAGTPASFVAKQLSGLAVVGTRTSARKISFSVVNFPDFLSQEESGTYQNSVTLADQKYEITVLPIDSARELFDTLKIHGGFGSTHQVVIKRLDDAPVPFEDAGEMLDCVHNFLSFARGAWVGFTPPIGIDENDSPLWREVGLRLGDAWSPRISWADRHNYQVLPAAYAGFADLWSGHQWRSVLRKAIYWYLRSNNSSSGIDGGIILTQAALESLAWSYLVDQGQRLSKQGFDKIPASDRLRLLLAGLDIPLAVPTTMPDLAGFGDWDGPRVFTEIRNDLVHPVRRVGRFSAGRVPYFAAWNLGQWYLEMAILRLAGFNGIHSQRTRPNRWVGEVHNVPWQLDAS